MMLFCYIVVFYCCSASLNINLGRRCMSKSVRGRTLEGLFPGGVPKIDFANPIYDLIERKFYKSSHEFKSGQFLALPFPTGIGKTYNTLSFALQFLLDEIERELNSEGEYTPRYCYYITNSVDNVHNAYLDLLDRIDEINSFSSAQKNLLKESILYAPNNTTTLYTMFDEYSDVLERIYEVFEVDKTKELYNGLNQVRSQYYAANSIKGNQSDIKIFQDQLAERASQAYSRLVLHLQKKLKKDQTNQLKGQVRLLKKLIPGSLLEPEIGRVRIVFMTTKKFMFGLHQTTKKFYPSANLSENYLIIDEIDRQQAEILDHLTRANEIDILSIIRSIYAHSKTAKLPQKPKYDGINVLLEAYFEKVREFYESHHLECSFLLHKGLENSKKQVLLFSDKLATHITSFEKKLVFQTNQKYDFHEIGIKGEIGAHEVDFPKFIGAMEKLANRDFFYLMQNVVEQYQKNMARLEQKRKSKNGLNKHEPEDAPDAIIATVLEHLHLFHLVDHMKVLLLHHTGRKKEKEFNLGDYHIRGLNLIEVDRHENVIDSVLFRQHGFARTPTGMLGDWVLAGGNILGVSATAECESVIHNFDMKHLAHRLGSRWIELTSDDRKIVQDYYNLERNYHHAKINLDAREVVTDVNHIKGLIARWRGKPIAHQEVFYRAFFKPEKGHQYDHSLRELSKICIAIEAFLDAPNNRYMMLMLNAGIVKLAFKDKEYTNKKEACLASFLEWYVAYLSAKKEIDTKLVLGVNAAYLKQGKFETDVIAHLENHSGKVIVFTTYATMSSGKNPKYKFNHIHENNTLHNVGKREDLYTDIDAIYLQKPTHLISIDDRANRISNQLRLMHYGLSLQEGRFLSPNVAASWCNTVLTANNMDNACGEAKKRWYNTNIGSNCSEDALFSVYRMVEQAVGRTARTSIKRDTILLLLDEDLSPILAQDNRQSAILTHEYVALRKLAQEQSFQAPSLITREEQSQHNLALLHTRRGYQYINQRLRGLEHQPQEKDVALWEALRYAVLRIPASVSKPIEKDFYLHSNIADQYEYSAPKNENEIHKYTFFKYINPGDGNIKRTVSEAASKLPIFMKNPIVKDHFETQGFATAWEVGARYLLTPPMFINIYLGALGEEVGRAILQAQGCMISALPNEHYERFDGLLTFQDQTVLIDFKHWNLQAWRMRDEADRMLEMEKMAKKLRALPYQKLIVCNIHSEEAEEVRYYDQTFKPALPNDSQIIEIPALIEGENGEIASDNIRALLVWLQNK